MIFRELFSSSSPSKIYGDALEKCRAHPEVCVQISMKKMLIVEKTTLNF